MHFADHSPRVLVCFAIAGMHALVIYAALTLGPQMKSTTANRSIAVHFIAQTESRPPLRLPEAAVITADAVVTTLPAPLPLDLPLIAPSKRTISALQRSAAMPVEDPSIPKRVSAVEYLREPSPRYPPQSRRLREQGVVVLRVVIDERGQACEIAIESSSGHARLDHAAREAVAGAAFRPYVEDGAPRRALVLIPIEFFLNRGSA